MQKFAQYDDDMFRKPIKIFLQATITKAKYDIEGFGVPRA